MRFTRVLNAFAALLTGMLLLGCIIPMGWVRTSPDGQYVTIVRKPPDAPADSADLELALYHLDRREISPILRFSFDGDSPHCGLLHECAWTPDSRAVLLTWIPGGWSVDVATPSSEKGERGSADTSHDSERKPQVMLYEVASGRLTRLPLEVYLSRWSADGKYLMGLSDDEDQPSIHIYRTDSWIRTQQISLPEGWKVVSFDWARWINSEPATAVVHFEATDSAGASGRNLYLLRGAQLIPLTTTGDVQAFWVDRSGVVVRWARVQHGKFLAVFERPLQGGAPRRIALIPYATLPKDACIDETFYRFSPDGQRLAWQTDYGVSVLEITTGVIRTLHAHQPHKATDETRTDGEGWSFKLKQPAFIGFDWRDAETLVIQRDTGQLELHSVRAL
jgi:hypothetical protein